MSKLSAQVRTTLEVSVVRYLSGVRQLSVSQTAYYQALASNNPNYNVHMLGGSIAWAW
jgi:hypothetical protein